MAIQCDHGSGIGHTIKASGREVVKVGGPGHEFWVDGENYPNRPISEGHEPGDWRVEVSPRRPEKTNHFLNVLQVMDAASGPDLLPTFTIESEELIGIMISDRVVLFSKNGERVSGSLTITVPNSHSDLKYLVTDLKEGQWHVVGPSSHSLDATADGGAIYFYGAAGTYSLKSDA